MRDFAVASAGGVSVMSLVDGSLKNRSRNTGEPRPVTAVAADLSPLYAALMDADDRSDSQALALIGWMLFGVASAAQQAQDEAIGLLEELRLAARVATAGQGSPASLATLRNVLGRHGWLPPPGATPLQVLAAPVR